MTKWTITREQLDALERQYIAAKLKAAQDMRDMAKKEQGA